MATDTEISTQLARHIATTRYEDLSAATIANTKRALLDGIGVMTAASALSEEVRPFISLARTLGGTHEATILGTWEKVSASAAAFANGAMAHALDFEDALDTAPTHPNASLIPAALALAQAHGATGREFLAAMAVGCDISCRFALSAGPALEKSPWYPPPVLGAFGAVAAAAKLLRLDEGRVKDAMSLLLCQIACPGEIKHSEHTVIRAVREAFPAQAAVTSARLAAQGVRGFDTPLEGRGGFFNLFARGEFDAEELFGQLGKRYYIDELSYKPWPCCRGTHSYVEAAQQIRARHGIDWRHMKSIRAVIGPVQRMLSEPVERKRAPTTAIDAKFSIPFTVATAFIAPEVTLDSFSAEKRRDPHILSLAKRVGFEFREGASATYGALDVELDDATHVSVEISRPLGSPDRPLDDERLTAKFIDCVTRAARPLNASRARDWRDSIMRIDEADSVDRVIFGWCVEE